MQQTNYDEIIIAYLFNTFSDASRTYVGVSCSGILPDEVAVFSESVRCCWWMVSSHRCMYTHGSTYYMCVYIYIHNIYTHNIYIHNIYIYMYTRAYAFYQGSAYPYAHAHTHTHTHAHNCTPNIGTTAFYRNFRFKIALPISFFFYFYCLGGAKQGVADNFVLRLLLLFDQLREVASGRRSELPDDDPVSTLELIIFFLGSVQTQIQHMQVSLLES